MNTRTELNRLSTLFADRNLAAIFAAAERDVPGCAHRHEQAGAASAEPGRGPPARTRLTLASLESYRRPRRLAGAVSFWLLRAARWYLLDGPCALAQVDEYSPRVLGSHQRRISWSLRVCRLQSAQVQWQRFGYDPRRS